VLSPAGVDLFEDRVEVARADRFRVEVVAPLGAALQEGHHSTALLELVENLRPPVVVDLEMDFGRHLLPD